MKTLVIHVGYPKTATTTMQKSVFLKLDGEINYVGRDSRRNHNVFEFISKTLIGEWGGNLSACLPPSLREMDARQWDLLEWCNKGQGFCSGLLRHDQVNLFSDERLLFPYRSLQGADHYPSRIKQMLDDGDTEIKILCVLRKQEFLMQSLYAQKFKNSFMHHNSLNTPQRLFFDEGRLVDGEYSQIFDFSSQLAAYAGAFGRANIHVLLFEELVENPRNFLAQLSGALGVDAGKVERLYEKSSKFRVRNRARGGEYVVKLPTSKMPRQDFSVVSAIENLRCSRYPVLRAFAKMALGMANRKVVIPGFTEEERDKIRRAYREGNASLEMYGVSRESLERYGYV